MNPPNDHPCTACAYRHDDTCKWSDTARKVPPHVTWWPIDWDDPDYVSDCAGRSAPDEEDDDEC